MADGRKGLGGNYMLNAMFNTAAASVPSFIPEMFDRTPVLPDHQIRTARLRLRRVNEADLVNFIELFSDSAVMRFIGIEAGYVPSYKEIEQMHSGAVQVWKTRGYGRWSMFDAETGEFVGFCGFRSEQGKPELICALHERFWGLKLAAEAAGACLNYGYESLGFTEVKAFTRPNNRRARRVLDKLNAEFVNYVKFHGVEGAAYQLSPDSIEF